VGAGYSEEDHDKYMALMEVETEAQKLLSDTVDRMSEILKRKRLGNEKFSDASDKELIELNEKKDKYFSVLDQTRMEKEKVEAVIEKGKGSRIRVTGNVFMGVTIGIEGCLLPITNPTVGKKYLNEGGRIVSGNI
jgi:hypothetical protein